MHVSLLHGWLPPTLGAVAVAALVLGVDWLRRTIWHWLLVAGASAAIVVVLAWKLDISAQVGSTYPRSFLVWAALPIFAFGAAVVQWQAVGWIRRASVLLAVPLLLGFAGLLVNDHYAYVPTIGDLVGAPLPGQVAAQRARPHPGHPPDAHLAAVRRSDTTRHSRDRLRIPPPRRVHLRSARLLRRAAPEPSGLDAALGDAGLAR